MGRLRATLAKSSVDRYVQVEVAAAQSAVDRALLACHKATPGPDVPASRLRRMMKNLAGVKRALADVGRITPSYDTADPDLMTEDERAEQWRVQEAERRAAKEARQAEMRATAEAAAAAEVGD